MKLHIKISANDNGEQYQNTEGSSIVDDCSAVDAN